jgi:hypothetical protein
VLMRPTVLPTPEAAAATARAEQDRLPGVRRAKAEFDREQEKRLRSAEKYPSAAESEQKSPPSKIKQGRNNSDETARSFPAQTD